jgi:protein TonB
MPAPPPAAEKAAPPPASEQPVPPEPETVEAPPPPAVTPEPVAAVTPVALPVPPPSPRIKPDPPMEAAPVLKLLAETAVKKAPPSARPSDTPSAQEASLPADTAPAASTAPVKPQASAPGYGLASLGNPPPRYPSTARRRGLEGRVVLRVHVDADGTANRVEVMESSGHALLDRAARRAVLRWRFVPARLAGVPVTGTVDVPVTFRLKD